MSGKRLPKQETATFCGQRLTLVAFGSGRHRRYCAKLEGADAGEVDLVPYTRWRGDRALQAQWRLPGARISGDAKKTAQEAFDSLAQTARDLSTPLCRAFHGKGELP